MMNELYVITVPACDWDGRSHTAFTVNGEAGGVLRTSSGWTLKDANVFEDGLLVIYQINLLREVLNMIQPVQ